MLYIESSRETKQVFWFIYYLRFIRRILLVNYWGRVMSDNSVFVAFLLIVGMTSKILFTGGEN
jgi:hypothetical protein